MYRDITATIKYFTEKAVLIEYEGEEIWLPFSQIEITPMLFEIGDEVAVTMNEWSIREKSLIHGISI